MSFNPFINGGGGTSSEDKVARAEIAAIKDGETLDSFSDVETALDDKADSTTTYTKTEVDTALGNKADKSTTYTKTEVDTALGNKVDKVSGKGLSTNDYTDVEKTKLAGIAEGAEVNEIESIKVNNTTINPDANKVVNITVPTTAADVSALPDTTKYAVALSLTINSSTFVMTGQLKDQNGDNLGTAQTIDLPLESVVVGGSYNSQTKKVVLTLQNGNTIEFSVADLVSGLQTELSTSNKLNPAFIEYDSTHRAVSDTEKSTWNGKQNALSSTQLDAVNSGINSTKVEQIETNKNNISTNKAALVELVNGGAKNKLPNKGTMTKDDITYTWIGGDVVVSGTKSAGSNYVDVMSFIPLSDIGLNVGDKIVISNNGTDCYLSIIFWSESQGYTASSDVVAGNNVITIPTGYTHIIARVGVKSAVTGTISETIRPMICTKADWDISQAYQPYAMSNAELTAKEQANENNISLVQEQANWNSNNGVKNLAPVSIVEKISSSEGFTVKTNCRLPAGDYIISFDYTSTSSAALQFFNSTGTRTKQLPPFVGSGHKSLSFTVTSQDDIAGYYFYTITAAKFENIMIRPAFIEDDTFEPYAMSNAELTAKEQANENNILFLNATAEITGWHKADETKSLVFDYAFSYAGTENVEYGFLCYRNGILNLDMTFVAKNMISDIVSVTKTSPTGTLGISDNGYGVYVRPYIKIGARYKYGEQVFTNFADAPNQ